MRNKIAYTAGLLGMAVLGLWMAVRRDRSVARHRAFAGISAFDVDDDTAALLIAQYRPAIERALTKPV